MSILLEAKLRSIVKQNRRRKRDKREQQLNRDFKQDMEQEQSERAHAVKQKQIAELIDTIKAIQLISPQYDVSDLKTRLRCLLLSKS